tara:strand:+ start:4094 stop:4381 length:288 start_codon:yes stop_codon:yes gene_type:complete
VSEELKDPAGERPGLRLGMELLSGILAKFWVVAGCVRLEEKYPPRSCLDCPWEIAGVWTRVELLESGAGVGILLSGGGLCTIVWDLDERDPPAGV